MKIKIGNKGRHFTIPNDMVQVTTGNCQQGDYFVDVNTLKITLCEADDIGMPAETFDCLLRRQEQP